MNYNEEYTDSWYYYLVKLYKEYSYIVNKKSDFKFNLNSLLNNGDFLMWCINLYENTMIYKDFLLSMDIPLNKETVIEVNKGCFDTLGKDLVSIVSKYANTLDLPKSHLLTGNNNPVILCNNKLYYPDNCELFLTHNDLNATKQLLTLHDKGHNILLGAYGKQEEKHLWFKVINEILKQDDSFKLEYDTLNGNYYSFITNSNLTKRKILTR